MRKVDDHVAAGTGRKPIRVPRRVTGASGGQQDHQEHREARELQKWIRKARRLPKVRRELVNRIKAEIAAGTYETPEKLDIAIARMLRELAEE